MINQAPSLLPLSADTELAAATDPRSAPRHWRWPIGALLPLVVLLSLEVAARLELIPSRLFPPPSEVANTILALASRDLFSHIAVSTLRVATGFAIGALLAIGIGTLTGMNRRAEALLDPSFQALRAIPSLAWIPLLL